MAKDALCSASGAAHDASLPLDPNRHGQQVEVASAAEFVAARR